MGLFDDIRCEYPLPETEVPCPSVTFQTKDFPYPYCDKYLITEDGKLMKEVEGELVFTPHLGYIDFYDGDDNGGWWGYRARFIDGILDGIEVDRFAAPHTVHTGQQDI